MNCPIHRITQLTNKYEIDLFPSHSLSTSFKQNLNYILCTIDNN